MTAVRHSTMPAGPLVIVDAATLYYRAYYALPESMTAPDGHPHNAVRGFLQTITRLLTRFEPRGLVAAWDVDWRPQWRVDLLPSYKTHRVATDDEIAALEEVPDTLGPQIGAIAELLTAWGIPVLGAEGAEADDVIGTMVHRHDEVIIVSSDRDLVQVVSDEASLLQMTSGGMDKWPLLDPESVRTRYGVDPGSYVDFAILRGDPSDGLPGVRGIGEKTAAALIDAFGSLEALLARAAEDPVRPLTPRLANALLASVDYLTAARSVVTLRTDVALPDEVDRLPLRVADPERLGEIAREWGVTRFVDDAISAAHTELA